MRRALILAVAVGLACGGKAVIDGSSGAGGTGGSQTTTTTSSSTTSSSTSSSSSSSSGTVDCSGVGCSSAQYCDFPDNHCGDGAPGMCVPRPDNCVEEDWKLTCACDGMTYNGPCEAAMFGLDVSNDEICPAPLDTVPCGSTFCGYGTDYCLVQISDVGGWPDEYFCNPLPDVCYNTPNPTCACLANEPCGWNCEQDPDGSFTLICPGG